MDEQTNASQKFDTSTNQLEPDSYIRKYFTIIMYFICLATKKTNVRNDKIKL